MEECIFCKIARHELKSFIVYENEKVIAFLDIYPANKGHTLIAPKEHYTNIFEVPEDTLAEMIKVAKKVALALKEAFEAEGINIIMNNGAAAGQVIMHAHIHVIPRYSGDGIRFLLHQKPADESELKAVAEKIREAIA